jgi:hypothetical protein
MINFIAIPLASDSTHKLSNRMINKYWNERDVAGSDESLMRDVIPESEYIDWGQTQKASHCSRLLCLKFESSEPRARMLEFKHFYSVLYSH